MNRVYINENLYKDTSDIRKRVLNEVEKFGFKETKDPCEADFAVSIGGDGTFIDTARDALFADILGINKGTLGYLTEAEEADVEKAIQLYMQGNSIISHRMRLKCDKIEKSVLNDIVVVKDGSSVIDVKIFVDDKFVTKYYADGVIISTPTGSTGYAFSCGAPIVDPCSEMIIVTPIAPHTVMNRSLCLSPYSEVTVQLESARGGERCRIEADGARSELKVGESIKIRKFLHKTRIVQFSYTPGFLNRIMNKMGGVGNKM